ncbi:MAG: MOSC domain-containing protein [Pirellulaceae bacterium]
MNSPKGVWQVRGTILQIAVGLPRELPEETHGGRAHKAWTTAFYKHPVAQRVALRYLGLEGDGQADLKVHGGRDKAVLCYSSAHYRRWKEELKGRPEAQSMIDRQQFGPGAFGENLTIKKMSEELVCVGDIYHVGSATVQVSQPRRPCWKLARRWNLPQLTVWAIQTGRMGWYLRVLDEGEVIQGDELILVDRPHPDWSIQRLNRIFHFEKKNLEAARFLADCRELSETWQTEFRKRTQRAASDQSSSETE